MGMPLRERIDDEASRVRLAFVLDRQARIADELLALERQRFVHPFKLASVRQALLVYELEMQELTSVMA